MLKGDGSFGAHDRKHGGKLAQVQALGPSGLARQVQPVAAELRTAAVSKPERMAKAQAALASREAGGFLEDRRGGRPVKHEGRPWEAEGVSRRTWERRRKGGG